MIKLKIVNNPKQEKGESFSRKSKLNIQTVKKYLSTMKLQTFAMKINLIQSSKHLQRKANFIDRNNRIEKS